MRYHSNGSILPSRNDPDYDDPQIMSANRAAEEAHAKMEVAHALHGGGVAPVIPVSLDFSGENAHGAWQDELFRQSGRVRENGKVRGGVAGLRTCNGHRT